MLTNTIKILRTSQKTFFLWVIFLLLSSCAPKLYQTGIVSFVESEGNEIIILKSDDFGKTKEIATSNAEKLAIKQLIFEGVSGSPLNDPITREGRSLMEKHPNYFNQLFDKNGYRKFINCSELISSELLKSKKSFHNTVKVCIAYRNLRMDMEKNGVINKLGF
jgi:hypothetical protein